MAQPAIEAPVPSGLRRTWGRLAKRVALGSIPFVLLVVAWATASRHELLPAYLLPSPASTGAEFVRRVQTGTLFVHLSASLVRLLLGCMIGSALAVPLGFLIGLNRRAAAFFDPLINFLQSIAGIAWVPLAVLWLGFGLWAIVFVIANIAFFVILFNTVTGVVTVPKTLLDAARTLGATRYHVLVEVILPGALANIVTGVRLGVAFGWRSLIGAEMIAASTGLGFSIWDARSYFQSETIIVGIVTIGIVWLLMDRLLLRPIEVRTVERWGLVRRIA